MAKLKLRDIVIDVPENEVAFYLHAGYVKVEDKAAVPAEEPVKVFIPRKKPALSQDSREA